MQSPGALDYSAGDAGAGVPSGAGVSAGAAGRAPARTSSATRRIGTRRFIDVFWLVRPPLAEHGLALHWLDVVAPVAVGGLWMWVFVWQLGTRPLVPVNDPYLPAAEAA